MDIRNNKIQLSKIYFSYWDLLPDELQTLIMSYRRSQDNIDEKTAMHKLSLVKKKEQTLIQTYISFTALNKKWTRASNGYRNFTICDVVQPCGDLPRIEGYYLDYDRVLRSVFLGNDVDQALSRVNFIQAFLM